MRRAVELSEAELIAFARDARRLPVEMLADRYQVEDSEALAEFLTIDPPTIEQYAERRQGLQETVRLYARASNRANRLIRAMEALQGNQGAEQRFLQEVNRLTAIMVECGDIQAVVEELISTGDTLSLLAFMHNRTTANLKRLTLEGYHASISS